MKFLRYLSWRRSSRRINNWLVRRQWKLFKFALPAILASLLLVVVLGVVLFIHRQSDAIHQRYHRLALIALSGKQYEVARVACLRGIAESRTINERLEWTYYLAVALNGLGQITDAQALANIAAPLDHPGCVAAHLGVAQGLLSSTNLTTNTLAMAERHLKNALILDAQSIDANELLGRFYINAHQYQKARERLVKIYGAKPEIAELIGITYLFENNSVDGIPWANRAITAYEQKLIQSAPIYKDYDRIGLVRSLGIKQRLFPVRRATETAGSSTAVNSNVLPQDSPGFWLGMVRLLLLGGKFSAALETLENQNGASTNSIYCPAIAEICALWAGNIPPNQKDGSSLRLQLIKKGLKYAPENLKLMLLLVRATHSNDASASLATVLLNELVHQADGDEAAWWHFVLWTDARIRGDLIMGRQHLKAAYKFGPKIPAIENDMAMNLSLGNHQDLEEGLKIIQTLIEKYPKALELYDTRGQILAKLGRNEEAYEDLKFVIVSFPNRIDTKTTLSKVCTALGKPVPIAQELPSAELNQIRDLVKQGKFALAVDRLEKKMAAENNSTAAAYLADICALWVENTPENQQNSIERLKIIQRGLKQNPAQEKLRSFLIQATHGVDSAGIAAKDYLNQIVAAANGNDAAKWHLELGREARIRGDLIEARKHFQSGYELAPKLTEMRAELASVMIAGNSRDWEQALEIIKPVLDQFPENPNFRNIRGQLLAGIGEYKSASADLEFVVAKLPNAKESRLVLAQVYEKLGLQKQAEKQRQIANRVKLN